jgi:hypothetical protein
MLRGGSESSRMLRLMGGWNDVLVVAVVDRGGVVRTGRRALR